MIADVKIYFCCTLFTGRFKIWRFSWRIYSPLGNPVGNQLGWQQRIFVHVWRRTAPLLATWWISSFSGPSTLSVKGTDWKCIVFNSFLSYDFEPTNHTFYLKDVSWKDIEAFIRVVKALVIVSRNLDNIPFIASCQLIPSCISISSNVLTCMANGRELAKDEVTSVVLVCLFLEALYDPYFSYRKSIFNQTVDTSKIKYQPALLQAELIPFIYGKYFSCFYLC